MRPIPLLCRVALAALLLVNSSGCQSRGNAVASVPAADRVARADALLADLSGSDATRDQRLLTAAMLYVSAQAYANATDALNRIDTQRLPRERRGDFLVTAADAALGAAKPAEAARLLATAPVAAYPFINDLTDADRARVDERRAVALERSARLAEAAVERGRLSARTAGDQRKANNEALWALLARLDHGALQKLAADTDTVVAGWATLAQAWRSGNDSPALLPGRIEEWVRLHPSHPAATQLPETVGKARTSTQEAPLQVAALLPLTGKLAPVGRAIQHGLLTAWYAGNADGAAMPQLRFYDTGSTEFGAVYNIAVLDGAGLVLGPLDKEQVRQLQQRPTLPVPTLALNYPDTPGGPEQLWYFGLAGEDEAAQVARGALAEGLRRAVVLAPAGDWGERMAAQFQQAMVAGGGSVVSTAVYQGNGDYSNVVRQALDIGASEQRHQRLERLLGVTLAFSPRHRHDIDVLFIVGNTLQATQLAPAVQYHYAGGLPMLSTSHANSQPSATAAADLAGIRFVETPWMADPSLPQRRAAEAAWPDADPRYARLTALGVDAWRLGQHLPWLKAGSTEVLDGTSGRLSIDAGRSVHRELVWMRFRNGAGERIDGAGSP